MKKGGAMNFEIIETSIEGLIHIKSKVFGDDRGYFLESYNQKTLRELGFDKISRFGNETSLYNKEGKHTFYAKYLENTLRKNAKTVIMRPKCNNQLKKKEIFPWHNQRSRPVHGNRDCAAAIWCSSSHVV